MKYCFAIIVWVTLSSLSASNAEESWVCDDQSFSCSKLSSSSNEDQPSPQANRKDIPQPTAKVYKASYGGIEDIQDENQMYINSQLNKSFEYLLLATHFNSYQKNRPGFQKLYQKLSDRSFDDAIDLVKQLTRRGGMANFNRSPMGITSQESYNLDNVNELQSLDIALNHEKQLATEALHLHAECLHGILTDGEMSHYIEEKFLPQQAKSVRLVAGHANDLVGFMKQQSDAAVAVYLFDKYLMTQ